MYINKIQVHKNNVTGKIKQLIHPKLNNSTRWPFDQDNFYQPFEIQFH